MFLRGWRALREFDGLVSFTEDVKKDLNVDIPFCGFSIGCPDEAVPNENQLQPISSKKTAVYAGTLIYYNGIQELLEAYALLEPEYQLHIYGYGPMEYEVCKAAQEYPNIHFHGRYNPADTSKILGQYELLINPRHIDPAIENFTFPSKLVNYILTGKTVLTSDFKTLPSQYREFLYVLEDMQPETIANSIRNVFAKELRIRQKRAEAGVQFIEENQTYNKIAEKLIDFIAKL